MKKDIGKQEYRHSKILTIRRTYGETSGRGRHLENIVIVIINSKTNKYNLELLN